MKRYRILTPCLAAVLAAFFAASCASTPKGGVGTITKVNPYHLRPGERIQTEDRMIRFEQQHRLHGAITSEDFLSRFGHYVTVFWKLEQKGAATVRLEYTQANTGPTIFTKETTVSDAGHNNTTEFQVVGEEYRQNGPITSWRVTLLVGGESVSENKSFLWK